MAQYDRRILVPYLHDVCSTEILCAKLRRELSDCEKKISNLNTIINRKYEKPSCPFESDYLNGTNDNLGACIPGGIIAGIAAMVWITLGSFDLFAFVGFLGVLYGGFCIFMGIWTAYDDRSDARKRYEEALRKYKQELSNIEEKNKLIPSQKKTMETYVNLKTTLLNRLREAERLRDEVYGVNIIAKKYRNIYAAYYLYDFFSTSRETDLEKIIQTFLLEEIKQRLDKVITQNEQIILNQRYQIALQEKANQSIEENHRMIMKEIATMESNQELQMDYQNMIAKNQAVTNFILAADYIQKYR